MKVISISSFRDGGTVYLKVDVDGISREYYIDRRLGSGNKGEIYSKYPDGIQEEDGHIPDPGYVLRKELRHAVANYSYQNAGDCAGLIDFAFPPELHRHQIRINEIKASHPKAWEILEMMKRLDLASSQSWDTSWEKDLTKLVKIKDILDRE